MAKTFVEDLEDHNRVPFLRGILIHSLQHAGLEFDTASRIASEVRHDLADTALISTIDLSKMVLDQLKSLEDRGVVLRYENRNNPINVQIEQQCGRINPFSRLKFRNSLETIGLRPRDSEIVVQMLQEHLSNKSIQIIKSRHMAMLIYRYLRQSGELGPTVAHRWLVWHDFINSGRELIFLLGGTAGSGKSSTANTLANRLEIVHTQSTDMLREIMRTMIPERVMPVLHQSSFSAWKAFPEQQQDSVEVSESLLIQGYRSQADLLTLAIEAVIKRATREHVSLVLEGVHLHPAFMEKLQAETNAVVIPVMLGLTKRKHLLQRIKDRSTNVPDRGSEHYLQYFDEIWRLQTYLLSEADRTNIHIAVNESRDIVFSDIMRFTIATLEKTFDGTAEQVFGKQAFVDP
ncbi:MAG: AAA family ATPase [Gammaproteobacteria bacterium]|nr:AAA family ATPase [Gammaproteobacteria bacterium]